MINYIVPLIVIIIIVYALYKKVDIFDTFLLGVKEGIKVTVELFPTIFAMVVSITMLTKSNIILDISRLFGNIFTSIGFPEEVIPLALLRPVSGSSSLAILNDLLSRYTPDSFIGRLSSVIQSSTDTTIYIIGLYFSAVGIKKIRYSLVVGLLADLISVIISFIVVKLYFY